MIIAIKIEIKRFRFHINDSKMFNFAATMNQSKTIIFWNGSFLEAFIKSWIDTNTTF